MTTTKSRRPRKVETLSLDTLAQATGGDGPIYVPCGVVKDDKGRLVWEGMKRRDGSRHYYAVYDDGGRMAIDGSSMGYANRNEAGALSTYRPPPEPQPRRRRGT